ncbi:hypothetical protein LUZ60_004427 [Juncus effusus]|nr:hypothetical protein LUZ60_004427 [Juncus effusus]
MSKDLMDFSFHEGNKLLTLVCNEETLLDKKRRWLQSTASGSNDLRFLRKRPKFLSTKFIIESHIRSDEVSCENVKASVEKSFGSFSNNQFKHHVVKDHFDPFKIRKYENHEKAISYITNNLTNNALYKIAQVVSSNNSLKFEKTRSDSIEIIKSHFVSFLSDPYRNSQHFNKISKIFKDPINYLQNSPKLVTPLTKELQISIEKTLEGLDEMKFQELVTIHRKLRGIDVKKQPEFPPVIRAYCNMETLLERVKERCNKFLIDLEIGEELPIEFAKGLTIIILSNNYRLDRTNIPIYEFFPFSEEILRTQNEILKALKLVDKVKPDKLKPLRPILDPNDKIPRTSLRIALRKYLIEWLFLCDEMNLPNEAIQAINLINGGSKKQLDLFKKEAREKEGEEVLNVSCFLKSVVLNVINEKKEGENLKNYESDSNDNFENLENDDLDSNDNFENSGFEVCDNYFFNSDKQGLEQAYGSVSNYASNSCNYTNNNNNNNNLMGGSIEKKRDQIGGIESLIGKEKNWSEIELNEICDETALVAHKLIGNLIDGFFQFEKINVDESTRAYLLDGSQSHDNFKGGKGKSKISEEEMKANIMVKSVENVLPTLPKSKLDKIRRLMGQ